MINPKQLGKTASYTDFATGGAWPLVGTIEQYRTLAFAQTTAGQTLAALPAPTDATILFGIDIIVSGTVALTIGTILCNVGTTRATWNGAAWQSAATTPTTVLASGAAFMSATAQATTGTSSGAAVTVVSITVPAGPACTLDYSVRGATNGVANGGVSAGLFVGANATFGGATGGTLVPNSEIKATLSNSATAAVQGTGTGTLTVAATLVATTYVVGVWADGVVGGAALSDGNGRTSITYRQLPATTVVAGSVPVTVLTNGTVYSSTTFLTATASTAAGALTLMAVTVPGPGTYELDYIVRGTYANGSGLLAGLFTGANATTGGATGGTLVPNTEILSGFSNNAPSSASTATGTLTVVAGAATTYVVGVWFVGTTASAQSDLNGRCSITFRQLPTSSVSPLVGAMTGATSGAAGTAGYVGTAPIAGQQLNYWRGDATWAPYGSFPLTGAASAPPVSLTGALFTGGTTTTTKPQLLIEPAGTPSTGWSINGTGIAVNAPVGFTGNLFDGQVGGIAKWNVDATGASRFYAVSDAAVVNFERLATNFSGGGFNLLVEAGGTGASRALIIGTNSSSSGKLTFQTSGSNRWSVNGSTGALESQAVGITLGFGGGTADTILSRPGAANLQQGAADAIAPIAQKFSVQSVVGGTLNTAAPDRIISGAQSTGSQPGGGIRLQVAPAGISGTAQNALADALVIDSTKLATFSGAVKTTAVNFAQLPSASAVGAGAIHFVLDSMTSKLTGQGTAAAGGGANKVPVYSDGTSWMIN